MSGLAEIKQWVEKEIDLTDFTNIDDAYEHLNDSDNFDWRNDLDDILLDEKQKFLDWLKTQISEPEPEEPEEIDSQLKEFAIENDLVFVGGYSYERNGKTINVKSYTRRKST
jgi:hypothetical protein